MRLDQRVSLKGQWAEIGSKGVIKGTVGWDWTRTTTVDAVGYKKKNKKYHSLPTCNFLFLQIVLLNSWECIIFLLFSKKGQEFGKHFFIKLTM